MSTFQSEYEDTTNTIDTIVSSQLSSVLTWINIPGGLTKVVSSSSGFAWGYNSDNTVWSCQLPCSGNWQSSDLSSFSVGTVLDIAADSTEVYVLYTAMNGSTNILSTSANRQGSWAVISVPVPATKIFSTHTYLWAQDSGNNKRMCPKPCNMSNWMTADDTTVTITSATDTTLYGKDPSGVAMQTDETMRSEWSPMSAFEKISVDTIVGGNGNVYAIDTNSNAYVYDGQTTKPATTSGYTPVNLTAGNNELWMTSDTPGTLGNVFHRIENPDYTSVITKVAPLDKKRDEVVSSLESKFNLQTDVMTVNKQSKDVIDFFKKMFKLDGDTAKKSKSQMGHINEQIRSTQNQIDQMNALEPILGILIIMLAAICVVYIVLGGMISHIVAIAILSVGTFFILNSK
jgi:hypothetical protein